MLSSGIGRKQWPWHAVICTVVLVVFTITWSAQAAFADDEGLVGHIEAMPADGLIGEWQVDDLVFTTSEATQFPQEENDYTIGRCVEVDYVSVASQAVATKVAIKSADDCQADGVPTIPTVPSETTTPDPSETATATPQPTATHDDDEHGDDEHGDDEHGDDDGIRVRARIETLPSGTLRGVWTIGGVRYEIGRQTHLRQKEGHFRVGACVELRYIGDAEPFTALRLETERASKCEHDATPTPGSTIPAPTPHPSRTPDDDEDGSEIHGILDSFPAELIGAWVIAGESYTATTDTEFEQERGMFEVGKCVKAHLSTTDASLIHEVETTNSFRCGDSDSDGNARGELYGVIQEFPSELIGDWQIGGTTVTADAATDFDQRRAAFDQGVTVKVRFVVRTDGTFYAIEIETKFANGQHHDDDDHDHDGVYEGAEGHAYGLIESLPTDLLGNWEVAGISYTVTSETRFVQPHSEFEVGRLVFVKYRMGVDGNRIARQIKTTRDHGGASSEGHATLYGFVTQMPSGGFVGEWIVDGVTFQARDMTKFKEEHGMLGLGSYVKVEYFTVEGRNIVHEIETEVPPGAGDDSNIGEIEAMEDEDNVSTQSAAAATATVATWTIGGQQYVVTAATDLNDFQGALAVGEQAFVNSYIAGDGSQVATQIRGVTMDFALFLPVVNK